MVIQNYPNLNNISISTDDNSFEELKNLNFEKSNIKIFFRNLKIHLIKEIKKCDAVFGCIAWLTDYDILNELKNKITSIIINKEDFLRPDLNNISKSEFRFRYDSINKTSERMEHHNRLRELSFCSDPTIQCIRCVGYSGKNTNRPRMHNKFLVFCKKEIKNKGENYDDINFIPYAIWTGSFNLTKNANLSFENAILIYDKSIAEKYYQEYGEIASLSEELNWNYEYVAPEWRIGS